MSTTAPDPVTADPSRPRTLCAASTAHALHDRYTDTIDELLPVWQAELGSGYGLLAPLPGVCAGAMAGLQVPAGRLAGRPGGRLLHAAGPCCRRSALRSPAFRAAQPAE